MSDEQPDDPYLGMRVTPQVVLTRRLGAGAMGLVYLARHEGTQSDVVVKILAPRLASQPEIRERFRAEAIAVNMAQHPHIVRVWDVGEAAELHYVIMEYLEGITLEELFETQLPDFAHQSAAQTTRILRLMGQAAQALAAIHEVGVVHRDLKPANMMTVSVRGGNVETLKLLDFGLAKLSAGATLDGVTMGTPEYMPPEQIFSAAETDSAADVYSLGTILYEALVGDTPFALPELPRKPGVEEYAAAWTAFKEAKRAGAPALPESIPSALRRLIGQMLDGDPQRRPSASEVSNQLQAFHVSQRRRRLLGELHQWQEQGQRPEDLLSGAALEQAFAGVENVGALSDDLRHFLLSSERREAPLRRRRVRRLLGVTLGASVLLLLVTVSLAFGVTQSKRAKRSTRVAKRAKAEKRACSQELVQLADDANQLTRDAAKSKTEIVAAEKRVRTLADNVKQGKASGTQLKKAVARLQRIRVGYVVKQRKAKKANERLQKLSAGLKQELQACVTEQKKCTDLKKGLGKQLTACQAAKRTVTAARTRCEQALVTSKRDQATCAGSLTGCNQARTKCGHDLAGCLTARGAANKRLATCSTERTALQTKGQQCAAARASATKGLATCRSQLTPLTACPAQRTRCRSGLTACKANLKTCRAPQPARP